LGRICLAVGAGGRDTREDGTGGEGVLGTGGGRELATSCVSRCSYAVRAASMVLMLFSEMFCLLVSSWRWCCRYPKVLAMPWGVSGITPYKSLGKLSDILHLNNGNNQLERQARPPQKCSSRHLVVDLSI